MTLRAEKYMQRSQWLAVFTGAIAILLGVGYLVLVQILDMRGEMIPAPVGILARFYSFI